MREKNSVDKVPQPARRKEENPLIRQTRNQIKTVLNRATSAKELLTGLMNVTKNSSCSPYLEVGGQRFYLPEVVEKMSGYVNSNDISSLNGVPQVEGWNLYSRIIFLARSDWAKDQITHVVANINTFDELINKLKQIGDQVNAIVTPKGKVYYLKHIIEWVEGVRNGKTELIGHITFCCGLRSTVEKLIEKQNKPLAKAKKLLNRVLQNRSSSPNRVGLRHEGGVGMSVAPQARDYHDVRRGVLNKPEAELPKTHGAEILGDNYYRRLIEGMRRFRFIGAQEAVASCVLGHPKDRRKTHNEDRVVVDSRGLAVVIDGMGGVEDVDVAAKIFAEMVQKAHNSWNKNRPWNWDEVITQIADEFNQQLKTPRSGVVFSGAKIFKEPDSDRRYLDVVYMGDSQLVVIGNDGEVKDSTEKETRTVIMDGREREVVTNALAKAEVYQLNNKKVYIDDGDLVILASDGVWSNIDFRRLSVLAQSVGFDPKALTEKISNIVFNGKPDNVSLVVLKF